MPIITNEEDYKQSMEALDYYFMNEPGIDTPEGDKFAALIQDVMAYERIHYPIGEVGSSVENEVTKK